MKKSLSRLAAGIISAAVLVPAIAAAQTTDANAQITTLLAQIKALQSQVMELMKQNASSTGGMMKERENHGGMMGSSTSPFGIAGGCPTFVRDLKRGDSGDDVSELQRQLSQDSDVFPQASVTGFFGPMTEKAVKKFQEKFGISSSSTGFFGPRSREHMRGHCGIGKDEGKGLMGSSTMKMRDNSGRGNGGDDFHPMQDMRGPNGMMPLMGASTTPRDVEHQGPQNF